MATIVYEHVQDQVYSEEDGGMIPVDFWRWEHPACGIGGSGYDTEPEARTDCESHLAHCKVADR